MAEERAIEQWEYLVRGRFHERDMHELGREGWELVTVTETSLYFKRRRALKGEARK